ncbi:hypothetical protein TPV1_gp24 [Thermococcus prieurii virus 1]|uniref:hypothetical protein n=1 Tax=Thermococcus prieurii virus 1 TaxID=1115696 RepID=UPI00024FB21E|nr:hypothetical protein TPV1_gp24 [Thermococcus prieurii virus 1]AEY69072.1 hypothetical protein [Thermococcus prieurii virus 1]AFA44836.1 hypothetical protein [Thermococcus prieurii virus 1]
MEPRQTPRKPREVRVQPPRPGQSQAPGPWKGRPQVRVQEDSRESCLPGRGRSDSSLPKGPRPGRFELAEENVREVMWYGEEERHFRKSPAHPGQESGRGKEAKQAREGNPCSGHPRSPEEGSPQAPQEGQTPPQETPQEAPQAQVKGRFSRPNPHLFWRARSGEAEEEKETEKEHAKSSRTL